MLLGLAAAASFFYRLGAVGLIGPDESSYAEVAREMVGLSDGVTPHLMGRPWLDKPPALFWIQAASQKLLGENELAVRLPSALAAVATSAVVAFLGFRLFGPAAGMASALILSTTLGLTVFGRAAIPDTLLTFALTLGLAAYLVYSGGRRSSGWLALAFAAFGLAVLVKGPVGLVLPLLQITFFHAIAGRQGPKARARAKSLAVAAASFLAVAAPWHLLILKAQGWSFLEEFLLEHNLDRYLTTVHRHPGSVLYYVPVLLAELFPWSVLLPGAAAQATRQSGVAGRYLLIWVGVPFLFFSLAGSKLPGYALPILPPCALLIGNYLTAEARPTAWTFPAHPFVALGLAAAILYAFARHPALSLGDGLPLAGALALASGAAWLYSRRKPQAILPSLSASSLLLSTVLVLDTAPRLEPYYSLKTLTLLARPRLVPGEKLICYKSFYREALFYSQGRLSDVWTLQEIALRAGQRGRLLALMERWRYEELALAPSLEVEIRCEVGGRVLAEIIPRPGVLSAEEGRREGASPCEPGCRGGAESDKRLRP